jgi:hypothetical protein
MTDLELTPAGRQVERALAEGYTVAAYNFYYANIRDEVAMVEGDWPEWHRMIQARVGERLVLTEEEAEHEPSIIERRIRNELGEVVGVEQVPNPHVDDCDCELCGG